MGILFYSIEDRVGEKIFAGFFFSKIISSFSSAENVHVMIIRGAQSRGRRHQFLRGDKLIARILNAPCREVRATAARGISRLDN